MKGQEVFKGAVSIQKKKIFSTVYNQKADEKVFTFSICNNLLPKTVLRQNLKLA